MARRDLDDDAPWLAEAAPAPRTEVSRRSFVWTLLIVLALATIAVVGAVLLMAKKDGGSTQGYMNAEQAPVITAEPGPYKIKPVDPAGMQIEGIDGTMYDAGAGIDAGSAIDPSLAPEVPLPRPGAGTIAPRPGAGTDMPRPGTDRGVPEDLLPEGMDEVPPPPPIIAAPSIAPKPAPATPVVKLAPPVIKPAPLKPVAKPLVELPPPPAATAKAGSVQLGAFSSEAKADAAWAGVAAKYGLSGKRISAVESSGKTLYRLRATSADPAATCARMKAAGEACGIVE